MQAKCHRRKRAVLSTVFTFVLCGVRAVLAQEQGIINNADSPYVPFKSINIGDCQWTDGFWAERYETCEKVMVPHMGELLKGDIGHAYNNFKLAAGLRKGRQGGTLWHDGDFYKWMESAVYIYANNKDPKILADLEEIIEVIGQAQLENGYLQTQIQNRNNREPYSNRQNHEMYNSGHLMMTACIHHRVTGHRNFLDIAVKHADHIIDVFWDETEKTGRFGFNQSQIMGLAELYRTTRDKRYLEMAEKFINRRGRYEPLDHDTVSSRGLGDMVQERTPLREETEAVGHAVLALYYYCGAADVYGETGEQALIDALDRLWNNVINQKMYVTGAVGQRHYGMSSGKDIIHEGFIEEYMMPNLTAYNETCANIANAMFSYRLLGVKGESKYADIMELVLLNSALSGISLEGTHYFYVNPLRKLHGALNYSGSEAASREAYIRCFCCPPNIVRTIAKVSGWAYSLTPNGVSVNLYGGNKLTTHLQDGSALQLKQETQYPWDGAVKITVESCKTAPFEMQLRIPDWAAGSRIKLNGNDAGVEVQAGHFAQINRAWQAGDVIELDMPMDIKLMEGNPRIEEVRNQAAIKRGPVVYCMESPDLPEGTSILDLYLKADSKLKAKFNPDLLCGVTAIEGKVALRQDHAGGMYHEVTKPKFKSFKTQFVPYFAWNNRGESEMTVFVPMIWE